MIITSFILWRGSAFGTFTTLLHKAKTNIAIKQCCKVKLYAVAGKVLNKLLCVETCTE